MLLGWSCCRLTSPTALHWAARVCWRVCASRMAGWWARKGWSSSSGSSRAHAYPTRCGGGGGSRPQHACFNAVQCSTAMRGHSFSQRPSQRASSSCRPSACAHSKGMKYRVSSASQWCISYGCAAGCCFRLLLNLALAAVLVAATPSLAGGPCNQPCAWWLWGQTVQWFMHTCQAWRSMEGLRS